MPLSAKNNLDEMYAKQRLLREEAARLEEERDENESRAGDSGADRRYILDLEIDALLGEATRFDSLIADILERDLDR
jgi:hypothetical protein